MEHQPPTKKQILELLPQKPPFRFVDEILEVDDHHIVAKYRFRTDEFYYAGHFPGNPITPGVILLEAMGQAGIVCQGIWLLSKEIGTEKISDYVTFFTDGQVEFNLPVYPGDEITIFAEKIFWRRKKIQSKVEIKNSEGKIVASGIVSGMGVLK